MHHSRTLLGKKRTKTREKSSFSTIGESVDNVIITQLLSCKICKVLQDSLKTGILDYPLARFALSCKVFTRLASACKDLARIPCFVRNLQEKCKISISSKLGYKHNFIITVLKSNRPLSLMILLCRISSIPVSENRLSQLLL